MAERSRLIAGAMSGTSADGVDVAIVRVGGVGLNMTADLILHQHRPYDAPLKQAIFAMRGDGQITLAELARVGREISLAYAACVNAALLAANLKTEDLTAVAAHGQTLFHQPPNTIQWLDPALIAAETGCAVVSDFRRADCAAGGQGAPLVPFADYVLFRHATKNRVLLNIGGIANLTYIQAGGSIDQLVAFDTGPGNCMSDWICRQYGSVGLSHDENGAGAMRGQVMQEVVGRFMAEPYFSKAPPKSTDGPAMVETFQKSLGSLNCEMNDLLATSAYLTATAVAMAVSESIPESAVPLELIVSGGGIFNRAIMGWLGALIGARASIKTTHALNVQPEAKEAIAFALLAAATLDGVPSNVPSCTGAKRPAVLGSVTPKPYNSAQ
jgi:anhydro-N-acetylmuramic acid kinase